MLYLGSASAGFVFKSGDKAFAAPKLDGAAVCKRFGFADGVIVIGAHQQFVSIEIAVEPNGIGSVVCQGQTPYAGAMTES